jgi:putative transcriptional regulator
MKPGIFLTSTSLLDDTFFEKSVIFITEYNEKGAMGFVVNKKFPRKLNELEEFKKGIPFPLYHGGPVDQEHLYFVHRRADLIPGGTPVADGIHLGGDFREALKYINTGILDKKDIKIFIGYCGWDDRELDEEIAEGSWQVRQEGTLF